MISEPLKIVFRRFRDRSLESGLLVIAVALGIGAFSAGASLIMNTISFSTEVMSSPSYRELVVSTRSRADEMETPVKEILADDNAVLTSADLEAADLAPDVEWAYVQNRSRLHLIGSGTDNFAAPDAAAPPDAPGEGSAAEGVFRLSDEEIAAASGDSTVIISDLGEINGYEVTPEFFNAWDISAAAGSLFADSDISGTDNVIILGSKLARLIAGNGASPESLIGKKLLARQGYQTIIGILEPVTDTYDASFFAPYKDLTGGFAEFRRMFMDTQLRFAVSDPAKLDSTAALLSEWFTSQFGEERVVISNPRAEAQQLISRNTGVSLLILFLSAAGFFIALVNVSNILMSRVLRMKKSVGILMALGATKKSIMKLFLAEAVLLAVSGGITGAILAIPLSDYMRTAAGISSGSWLYVAAGAVAAGILTVLFAIIPSGQYMKIDPAQAMRSAS